MGAATPHHILDVVDMSLKREAHSSGALEKLKQCCVHVVHIFNLQRAPKPLETDGIWEMKLITVMIMSVKN